MESLADEQPETVSKHSVSLEVELVWRIHLLSPQHYVADCMRHFGRVIGHKCNDSNAVYPIRLHHKGQKQEANGTGFISAELKMTDAIKRQCDFMQKMLKMNLNIEGFVGDKIDSAIDRYEQFLTAMWAPYKQQDLIFVPTVDIDLIWHSHQLDPVGYQSFCIQKSPNRRLVSHDDNISSSTLRKMEKRTESFWNREYGAGTYKKGNVFSQTASDKKPFYRFEASNGQRILFGIALFVAGTLSMSWDQFIPGGVCLGILFLHIIRECRRPHEGD